MIGLSARSCGGTIAVAGVLLGLFHLGDLLRWRSAPVAVLLEGAIPLALALTLVAAGYALARGSLVTDQFAALTLAWAMAGGATLLAASIWLLSEVWMTPLPVKEDKSW